VKALQGFGVWSDFQSVDTCRAICSAKGFVMSGLNNAKRELLNVISKCKLTRCRMLVWQFAELDVDQSSLAVLQQPLPGQYGAELRTVEHYRAVSIDR
jgi:hypothetical protein